jgi:tellurite resistance protein
VTLLARGRLTAADAARRLEQIATETAKAGRDARLATLGARLADATARRVTLVLAADVAAADGVLHEAEHQQCLALAAALGIEPEEAAALGIHAVPVEPHE